MNKETITLEPQEKILKQLAVEHEAWLLLPTTQQALSILIKRKKVFTETLQQDVLVRTDEKRQDSLRTCISTVEAIIKILSDTDKFVSFSVQTIDTK